MAAQFGSLLYVLFCLAIGVRVFLDLRSGRLGLGTPDYAGFYAAASILNTHKAERLYDRELEDQILHAHVPSCPSDSHFPFGHAPIVAGLLRPLARLPFAWSYAVWLTVLLAVVGLVLGLCGSILAWPVAQKRGAQLMAAAFPPLALEGWTAGQWCVVSLVWVVLTLRLLRDDRPFPAGVALAMCAAKPTLLMFVLPVVVVSGRWRLVAGLAVGGLILATVCLAIVGADGIAGYIQTLTAYSRTMAAGAKHFRVFKHVDLHSFLVMLCGGPGWLPRVGVLTVAIAFVSPLLGAWWLRASRGGDWQLLALCATLTGNMVFSAYTPIYDVSLMIPNVLITGDIVYRRCTRPQMCPWRGTWAALAALLVCAAWCTQEFAQAWGFQPLTLVLLAWAWFQLALVWWGPLQGESRRNFGDPELVQLLV